jgi:hypothetical protein
MKKIIIKALALSFALIILAASLASCENKLSGTYKSEEGTSYKFSLLGDKVVMNYIGIDVEGTYELDEENGKIYITILGDRQEYTFSKDGKTIVINDIEYVKD